MGIFKKVVGLDFTLDDKDEPVSYHQVLSFLGEMIILMNFCGYLGMSWWLVPLFFGIYFFIAISITLMRAKVGPPLHAIFLVNPKMV